jgi:fibronectin type 3 domain-containing protein
MKLIDVFFRINLIIFLGACLTCGCGKKMAPIPPDSLVPGEVRNFSVRQDGQAVRLEWLFPRVNIDNQPLTDIQGFRILRSQEALTFTAGCPPELKPVATIDLAFAQVGEVQGEQVRYRDGNLEPGNRYFYQVIGYDRGDHLGLPSPIVSQVWDVLPQQPARLEAQAGDRQVMLTWTTVTLLANGKSLSGGANYNVYREAQGSGFTLVNTSPVVEAKFQDITVANDVTYRYLVRTVRQVGSSSLESLDSPVQTVKPVDQTPPAPVLNLVAVATEKGIELRWEAGRELDLAGYRVYRRSLAEPRFRVLTAQLVAAPYFVDSDTAKGVTYYYYVVAVDTSRRANQSLSSEMVEVTR